MSRFRVLLLATAGVALLLFWFLRREPASPSRPSAALSSASLPAQPPPASAPPRGSPNIGATVAAEPEGISAALNLNAAGGTIAGDLELLNTVFTDWRLNFPRIGNPWGENVEITAALSGPNPRGAPLFPRNHPAINAAGEICDRWGTPFHFHALSGERMEIRSAGPDKKFGTVDDSVLTPP